MKVLGPFEITSVGTSVVSDGVVYEGVGVDVDDDTKRLRTLL